MFAYITLSTPVTSKEEEKQTKTAFWIKKLINIDTQYILEIHGIFLPNSPKKFLTLTCRPLPLLDTHFLTILLSVQCLLIFKSPVVVFAVLFFLALFTITAQEGRKEGTKKRVGTGSLDLLWKKQTQSQMLLPHPCTKIYGQERLRGAKKP